VGENCFPIPYNGTEDCPCIANDRRAIAFINALSPLPDAVIITGDITSSAWPTQWQKAKEILDTLRPPHWPVMGNHDIWVRTARAH
jgi:3',5'-cyclic AMP phosphodiesterase CpdA